MRATISARLAGGIERVRTRGGVRLEQHGTLLSVVLRKPGPTHSTVDVMAAAVEVLARGQRVALLGFAGGGMIGPLRALGGGNRIEAVDISNAGFGLFRELCGSWCGGVELVRAEAGSWLARGSDRYGMVVEDLSVARAGDVVKPEATWGRLPWLVKRRLAPGGVALFNLLRPVEGGWAWGTGRVLRPFGFGHVVLFKELENRLLLVGRHGRSAGWLSRRLKGALRRLGSRLADQIRVRRIGLGPACSGGDDKAG